MAEDDDLESGSDLEDEQPAEQKSKMPIFIGIGVLVLALVGGGAFFFLSAGKDADTTTVAEVEEEPLGPPPVYIDMKTIMVPLMVKDRLSHYVYLDIRLETVDEKAAERVNIRLPILRDKFVSYVNAEPVNHPVHSFRVDLDRLKAVFLDAASDVFGPDKITAVLVRQAIPGAN